ncbi:hypothetical protein NG796_16710 [Laspinema sp. A4]|uniref:hypothetical protein n=1 Tax=Laspinema sp. D2d TaxID=2953686 RepID=UPI0021BB7EBD|nr:hypothetical protein [Laspinema sp. D2d]MCT7984914.1 hypothetical protein [Laspinema sp. D2d]
MSLVPGSRLELNAIAHGRNRSHRVWVSLLVVAWNSMRSPTGETEVIELVFGRQC